MSAIENKTWGSIAVVQYLPSIYKDLDVMPALTKQINRTK